MVWSVTCLSPEFPLLVLKQLVWLRGVFSPWRHSKMGTSRGKCRRRTRPGWRRRTPPSTSAILCRLLCTDSRWLWFCRKSDSLEASDSGSTRTGLQTRRFWSNTLIFLLLLLSTQRFIVPPDIYPAHKKKIVPLKEIKSSTCTWCHLFIKMIKGRLPQIFLVIKKLEMRNLAENWQTLVEMEKLIILSCTLSDYCLRV